MVLTMRVYEEKKKKMILESLPCFRELDSTCTYLHKQKGIKALTYTSRKASRHLLTQEKAIKALYMVNWYEIY